MTQLLRIPQVAQQLGISTRAVFRLLETGELRAVKIGEKATRIRIEDLETFIANAPIRSVGKTKEETK